MKVFIPAAGLGSRLYPLTKHTPKALVDVAGKPLLQHVLDKVIAEGATEIVVNVGHLAEQVIDYLRLNYFTVPIYISDEREGLLDTGGGIKQAAKLFESYGPILVHNVDILSTADISGFYDKYSTQDAALMVSDRVSTRHLLFDRQENLKGWENTITGELRNCDIDERKNLYPFAFSGIHIIGEKIINEMETYPKVFSIIDFYLQQASKYKIRAYNDKHLQLLDVGKPRALERAPLFLRKHHL